MNDEFESHPEIESRYGHDALDGGMLNACKRQRYHSLLNSNQAREETWNVIRRPPAEYVPPIRTPRFEKVDVRGRRIRHREQKHTTLIRVGIVIGIVGTLVALAANMYRTVNVVVCQDNTMTPELDCGHEIEGTLVGVRDQAGKFSDSNLMENSDEHGHLTLHLPYPVYSNPYSLAVLSSEENEYTVVERNSRNYEIIFLNEH